MIINLKTMFLRPTFGKKTEKKRLLAEQRGYKVLTIWDSDYKKDKVSVLEKCLEFLQEKIK